MKRSELIPGQDYLYARGGDWEIGGGWGVELVTVVSDERVSKDDSYGFSRAPAKLFKLYDGVEVHVHAKRGGTGILVRDGGTGRIRVVQPAQIRGPWAETKARVDASKAAADAAREERRQARLERDARRRTLAGRIEALGLDVGDMLHAGGAHVGVPLATLEALVDIAERAGEE